MLLASASPRRRALLRLLGVSFSVLAADVDENPRAGEPPEALTTRLARTKALAVAANGTARPSGAAVPDISGVGVEPNPDDSTGSRLDRPPNARDPVVLGADTVVVLDGAILGKPADEAEARAMLAALRARDHRVLTGVALAVAGEVAWSGLVETRVSMRAYGADEVERYVRSGRPLDKAGGYGIQDADFRPVDRIEGCFANVVGLPLCEVRRALVTLDPERSWGPGWPSVAAADSDDPHAICERARAL